MAKKTQKITIFARFFKEKNGAGRGGSLVEELGPGGWVALPRGDPGPPNPLAQVLRPNFFRKFFGVAKKTWLEGLGVAPHFAQKIFCRESRAW